MPETVLPQNKTAWVRLDHTVMVEVCAKKCAIHLAANGWDDPGTQPSQDAAIPDNIRRPWNYDSILRYFYDNSKVSNMDTVSLVQ